MDYIIDYHGHVLTSDGEDFRFTPIDCVDTDNIIQIDTLKKSLFYRSKQIFFSERSGKIKLSFNPSNLMQINYYEDRFRISTLNIFLSSNPQGELLLTHLKESWETFLTISEETFELLKYMKNLSQKRAKEFSIENFSIQYGKNKFLIEHNKKSSLKDDVITLIDTNLSVVEIEKINPVVYFCAFSSENIVNSAILSIKSYEMFSNVPFTYVLFTNMYDFDFPKDILNLKVIYVESIGNINHLYKRYSQEVMSHLLPYSPIFYSDSDIICNADLNECVKKVMDSEIIYTNSEPHRETDFVINSGWFMSDFYQFDETIREKTIHPVNSGFFAFKSVKSFQFISTNMDRLSLVINTRHGGTHYAFDQSTFNYILTKFCTFDTEFLRKYIINWPDEDFSKIKNCGLIHFCGGVGQFSSKYEKMAAYFDYLKTASTSRKNNITNKCISTDTKAVRPKTSILSYE